MGNENLSTKYKILQILRSQSSCVSGQFIANECGVARTSVWKAVQSLNQAGYNISSEKNGYRLLKDKSDSLDPWEFGEYENIFVHFEKTTSTMDEARKLAQTLSAKNAELVTADIQTAGRGRGKHKWQTTKGSLAFTLLTKNSLSIFESHRTIMAAQIALVSALRQFAKKDFFVRWPNDVWSKKGKVAGVLDELAASGGSCEWQNLGIGVNVTHAPKILNTDSVFNSEINSARRKILFLFYKEFKKIENEIFFANNSLEKKWNSLCFDLNKKVALADSGGQKNFVFNGINSFGGAILSSAENSAKKVYAPGMVSIKKGALA